MASQDKVVSSGKEDELANNESFVNKLTQKTSKASNNSNTQRIWKRDRFNARGSMNDEWVKAQIINPNLATTDEIKTQKMVLETEKKKLLQFFGDKGKALMLKAAHCTDLKYNDNDCSNWMLLGKAWCAGGLEKINQDRLYFITNYYFEIFKQVFNISHQEFCERDFMTVENIGYDDTVPVSPNIKVTSLQALYSYKLSKMIEKLKSMGKEKHCVTITISRPECKEIWEELHCNGPYWKRKNTEYFVKNASGEQIEYAKVM